MALSDVTIEKRSGGIGRVAPNGDMISGLLANGVAVVGGAQLDTVYRLRSIQDAHAILLDPDYDTATLLVYEHIAEYFRLNPSGDLYVMIVAQATAFDTMVDVAVPGNAVKLLNEAEGNIRQLAVAYNPVAPVIDTSGLLAAIPKAQALATSEYALHRPVEIILEGKGFTHDAAIDLRALNAENVSVMVGQAMSVAAGDATYAAVGTLLGTVSRAAVNENIGWVQQFNVAGGSMASAGIGGVAINNITQGELDTLDDEGAIFLRTHTGIAGIYFNDSHTCTALLSDFAYIANNRTIHKAVRLIRTALLPRLASPVSLDPDTGRLSPEIVKSFESLGRRALEEMLRGNEVSGIDVFVDPEQDVLSTSRLDVEFSIVPTGTARTIRGFIGFENPF